MTLWFRTFKPVASSRFQLLLAAAIWSVVGAALLCVGGYWLLAQVHYSGLILLLLAMLLGLGKSLLVLDGSAHRTIGRIQVRGEGRCVGGFLSPQIWALVIGMMLLGRMLRNSGLPFWLLGMIYSAVGTGLLISSHAIWRAWKNH